MPYIGNLHCRGYEHCTSPTRITQAKHTCEDEEEEEQHCCNTNQQGHGLQEAHHNGTQSSKPALQDILRTHPIISFDTSAARPTHAHDKPPKWAANAYM
jgi:hypothetical protein